LASSIGDDPVQPQRGKWQIRHAPTSNQTRLFRRREPLRAALVRPYLYSLRCPRWDTSQKLCRFWGPGQRVRLRRIS